jgi:hypothetical protein
LNSFPAITKQLSMKSMQLSDIVLRARNRLSELE